MKVKLRSRYEHRNNTDFNSARNDSKGTWGHKYQFLMDYNLNDVPLFLELRYVKPKDSKKPESLEMQQLYADIGKKHKLRAGRQEIILGNGRLIAHRPWGEKGLKFDGLRFTADVNKIKTDVIALKEVPYHNPNANDNYLYGVYSSWKPKKKMLVDGFFLNKYEEKGGVGRELSIIRATGLRHKNAMGDFGYDLTGVYQFGRDGTRGRSAYGFMSELQYKMNKTKCKPTFAIGYDYLSGDSNPNDGTTKTYDVFYQKNHIYFGYMDLIGYRNVRDLNFSAKVFPVKNFYIYGGYHMFNLAQARDAWYKKNGTVFLQDPTGTWGTDMGNELDIELRYNAKTFDIRTGYSKFYPGQCVRNLKGKADPSDWYFISGEVKI
ncbi:MAG: alginate export family protein [Vulcanimicrobiota bacterium]